MIALVNPKATSWHYRIPLSILSIGASLEGTYPYEIIDGNLDKRIFETLPQIIRDKNIKYIALTVMPGPQVYQAIMLSQLIRQLFPFVKIIWGGYFPSLHTDVVLKSTYVDFVIRDQGDYSFKQLIDALVAGGSFAGIKGLSYYEGSIQHNQKQELIDPNERPPIPYHKVHIPHYIGKTCLGARTINYHSSVGCPFLCGFCAVAAVFNARWMGLKPQRIVDDLLGFKKHFAIDAVEFHDNNFFTSEKRTFEFADRIDGHDITWWGEARPDTLLNYEDRTWRAMKKSGCNMIFMGAESSSQKVLDLMDKGGTQTPDTVLTLAEKMRSLDIVPEFSFVLGNPTDSIEQDIESDINYIRKIKEINPKTEIIIYLYSPVHFEEAVLFSQARRHGFAYPEKLEDWLKPEWREHDLRKKPVTPWLSRKDIFRVKNFERTLHAYFPTNADPKLTKIKRHILKLFGTWRYRLKIYNAPYDLAVMQRLFHYRQPEIEGF